MEREECEASKKEIEALKKEIAEIEHKIIELIRLTITRQESPEELKMLYKERAKIQKELEIAMIKVNSLKRLCLFFRMIDTALVPPQKSQIGDESMKSGNIHHETSSNQSISSVGDTTESSAVLSISSQTKDHTPLPQEEIKKQSSTVPKETWNEEEAAQETVTEEKNVSSEPPRSAFEEAASSGISIEKEELEEEGNTNHESIGILCYSDVHQKLEKEILRSSRLERRLHLVEAQLQKEQEHSALLMIQLTKKSQRKIRKAPQVEKSEEEEVFTVDKIISHKKKGRQFLFLVKWKGYSQKHNSWVKKSDFVDSSLLDEYWGDKEEQVRGKRRFSRLPK
ncbi:hypothetical protein ADUPG1_013285 [Aduncisulcus paluster]|uniref:Chromo domain-containing protein n=1 Tax=Aduncisulcus paluster TaxID=2918883 RepID=A0ABQ5K2E0_9EUKA|nr:hypothetical protein ADUPG1_013285 [Aduncisulcus paluster]